MRISHEHKFIFIANQKTASSAIRLALDDYSDIHGVSDINSCYYYHTSALSLKNHFEKKGWNWNDYFKFTFVRNPWDLVVSHFFYRNKVLRNCIKTGCEGWVYNFFKESFNSVGFNKWVKTVGGSMTFINGHASTQKDMLVDKDGNCIVDFVGRYENLNSDFEFIRKKLGYNCNELSIENKSQHTHYSDYYNAESIEIVRNSYRPDINLFGYEFDEN